MPRSDMRFKGMRTPTIICDTTDASLSFTGCICRVDSDGSLTAARANTAANARGVGVVYQGHKYSGELLGQGPVKVRLVAGLDSGTEPEIGQIVYLSEATAGKATNVEPSGGTNQSVKLGVIQDLGADGYDNTNGSLCTILSVGMSPTV